MADITLTIPEVEFHFHGDGDTLVFVGRVDTELRELRITSGAVLTKEEPQRFVNQKVAQVLRELADVVENRKVPE